MLNRSLRLLVVAFCTILTQWACQPTRDMLVEPQAQDISIDEARSWLMSQQTTARSSREKSINRRNEYWHLAEKQQFTNGKPMVVVPLTYGFSPVFAVWATTPLDKNKSLDKQAHFVQSKLLIYKNDAGQMKVDLIQIIPTEEDRKQNKRVKGAKFSGYVLRYNQTGEHLLMSYRYVNGKVIDELKPGESSRQGRQASGNGFYLLYPPGEAPQGNYETVLINGELFLSNYSPLPAPDPYWGYGSGLPTLLNGDYGAPWWSPSNPGTTTGGGSSTGGSYTGYVPYYPETPVYEDKGGVGTSQADNFFSMMANYSPAILFTEEEKALIREYPQVIASLADYNIDFGGKPDVVKITNGFLATTNPYSETEDQLANRILKTLGVTDHSHLEQAPFSPPGGIGILTGLLYIQQVSREAAVLKLMHSDWSQARCLITAVKNVTLGTVHFVLDVFGLVPGAGELADGINGGIYLLEGDVGNAGFSFAAMLPIGGQLATVGKWAKNALKFDNSLKIFVSSKGLAYGLGSIDGNRLSHVFDHLNSSLTKRFQGVFSSSPSELVGLVDEAYEAALSRNITGVIDSRGYLTREIPMGKTVGWEGGTLGSGAELNTIKLVTKEESGVTYVITAYPIR